MKPEDLKKVLGVDGDETRAVSPVIGVILMVAITVILAAVIGTFVLGLGGEVSSSAPQASFSFELSDSDTNVTITHDGGDSISSDAVNISATDGFDANGGHSGVTDLAWNQVDGAPSDVTAGDQVEISNSGASDSWVGETVRVVWHDSSSDETATIGKFEP